jgi:hypothetical protein
MMDMISVLYPEGLSDADFVRVHLFYSLFTAIAHSLFGLQGLDAAQVNLRDGAIAKRARNGLDHVSEVFQIVTARETSFGSSLSPADGQFVEE